MLSGFIFLFGETINIGETALVCVDEVSVWEICSQNSRFICVLKTVIKYCKKRGRSIMPFPYFDALNKT